MSTEAEIIITNATELKPGSKYLLALDGDRVSEETAQQVLKGLKKMGIKNAVCLIVDGDPTTAVTIIEQGSE